MFIIDLSIVSELIPYSLLLIGWGTLKYNTTLLFRAKHILIYPRSYPENFSDKEDIVSKIM